MTNDQRHLQFVNLVDDLLKTLDKADVPGHGFLYKDKARQMRSQLKIQVGLQRMPKVKETKQKKVPHFSSTQSWLGR